MAFTLYFPSTVIETTVTFSIFPVVAPSRPLSTISHRHTAFGLDPGAIAALMNPGGFSHISSCHSSALDGAAIGSVPPSVCHA